MVAYSKPLPTIDAESAPFWSAARDGRLSLPRCKGCGRYHYYPRAICPYCHSLDLQWSDLGGKGTVYSFTIHRRPAGAEFNDDVPYVVALIDLDEKVRILAGVVGTPVDQVAIGQRVKVTFRPVNDQMALPMFEIAP